MFNYVVAASFGSRSRRVETVT